METIFYKAGYQLSKFSKSEAQTSVFTCLQINNPDGSPRWIWNASNTSPMFLKFYNVGSFRAFLFMCAIRMIFLMRLQRFVFKKSKFSIQSIASDAAFDYTKPWALFTGTIGPNNKVLVYDGTSFVKIAQTVQSASLLKSEFVTLKKLEEHTLVFHYPKVLSYTSDRLQIEDISQKGKRFKQIENLQLQAICDLDQLERKTVDVKDWHYFTTLRNRFLQLDTQKLPQNLVRKVQHILQSVDGMQTVELTFSHGDFTQWNMYKKEETIAIYDWELASTERPKGFDFFHLIFQNGILVHHHSWKTLSESIQKYADGLILEKIFTKDRSKLEEYLQWYLLINCMEYLLLYAEQEDWHIQVYWLFSVWTQALNNFLLPDFSQRQLLIMDLFDALQYQSYGVLKFHNGYPESLSESSDIDIILKKETEQKIVDFVKQHAFVNRVSTKTFTFMNSVQLFTQSGEILVLDLIWKLKRKQIQLMNVDELLASSYQNRFGVKIISSQHTAQYISMFYVLNNAPVPQKYHYYADVLEPSIHPLDQLLFEYYSVPEQSKQTITSYLKEQSFNQGWAKWRNKIGYSWDCILKFNLFTGYVITFSGVDGAGKSTVIEQLTQRIDKQLRKPVVVLRHRPSILPILSVWVKGKEEAQKAVLSNLPRKGTNTSYFNSLLRFSYYYLDYVLGQFVVYFKYCSRGYVVIYDRYYFDFINDSKRSNILLPKGMARLGYRFLLKPKFNFFLFADPETILKRKQELDKSTIEELTHSYRYLFQKLQDSSKSVVYQSIQNEDLKHTSNTIIRTLLKM